MIVNIYCNLKNVVDVTDSVKKGVPKKTKQIFWTLRLKFSYLSKWGNQICTKSQDFVVRSPIIWHLKPPKAAVFRCQKKGLRTPKSENGDNFCRQHSSNLEALTPDGPCLKWLMPSAKFLVNYENRWFQTHIGLIFPFWNPKIKTLWHHRSI